MCDKLVLAGAVASEGRAVAKRGGAEARCSLLPGADDAVLLVLLPLVQLVQGEWLETVREKRE